MDRIPFPIDQSLVDNPPKIFESVKYVLEGSVDDQVKDHFMAYVIFNHLVKCGINFFFI